MGEPLSWPFESTWSLVEDDPVPHAIIAKDSLRMLVTNRAAQRMYGLPSEALLTRTLSDLRHPEEALSGGFGTGIGRATERHFGSAGRLIWVNVYSRPVAFRGVEAWLLTIVDITGQIG